MVYTVAQSYRTYLTMDDTGAKRDVPERIRFEGLDEEAAGASSNRHGGRHMQGSSATNHNRPSLARSSTAISEDSLSIRPSSRRGSMAIEPAAALPIQYRTL